MQTIQQPLTIPELDLKPESAGAIELTPDMQQTLALLAGFWRNTRVLLKASPSGVLFTASPQIKGVVNVTGVGANYPYQGSNIPCSEVLVLAHPDNTGRIWVNPHAVAAADTGYPLDAGDPIGFGVTNLNMVHLLIVTAGEKAIIVYSE